MTDLIGMTVRHNRTIRNDRIDVNPAEFRAQRSPHFTELKVAPRVPHIVHSHELMRQAKPRLFSVVAEGWPPQAFTVLTPPVFNIDHAFQLVIHAVTRPLTVVAEGGPLIAPTVEASDIFKVDHGVRSMKAALGDAFPANPVRCGLLTVDLRAPLLRGVDHILRLVNAAHYIRFFQITETRRNIAATFQAVRLPVLHHAGKFVAPAVHGNLVPSVEGEAVERDSGTALDLTFRFRSPHRALKEDDE
eukprot:CAMPEP_0171451758 /NCGR_PEP_ID=MMETSP0945-20130129/132_1 /TAXON_ID=109269 /ORGANISM="Vaucheria litorea, Strain CCMP2940" /LENGTH=245 /DNA_ID=CAMNT_0011976277 /DNA_START=472 /DNA_END=1206 /DNA_ORIENTATION=-